MNRAKCKVSPRSFVAAPIVAVYDASSNVVSSALETVSGSNGRDYRSMLDQTAQCYRCSFWVAQPV